MGESGAREFCGQANCVCGAKNSGGNAHADANTDSITKILRRSDAVVFACRDRRDFDSWTSSLPHNVTNACTFIASRLSARLGGEFFEARIIPKRIEHRIEPEQRGSKRQAYSQWARVRYRE